MSQKNDRETQIPFTFFKLEVVFYVMDYVIGLVIIIDDPDLGRHFSYTELSDHVQFFGIFPAPRLQPFNDILIFPYLVIGLVYGGVDYLPYLRNIYAVKDLVYVAYG